MAGHMAVVKICKVWLENSIKKAQRASAGTCPNVVSLQLIYFYFPSDNQIWPALKLDKVDRTESACERGTPTPSAHDKLHG